MPARESLLKRARDKWGSVVIVGDPEDPLVRSIMRNGRRCVFIDKEKCPWFDDVDTAAYDYDH